ncbi:hypothetical protein TELCIR_04467 [Teladorsagia circumcincta]|uniref:Uncharacterized protein n=1 Tax=Teladorsagia circumcincta TaxID=45464 RepID=A0A2G9UTK1_TELCI|nr:hypothetical protein TELCIR_04467 [Teladorsagia circumcincta]
MKPVVARCEQFVARSANTLDRDRLFQEAVYEKSSSGLVQASLSSPVGGNPRMIPNAFKLYRKKICLECSSRRCLVMSLLKYTLKNFVNVNGNVNCGVVSRVGWNRLNDEGDDELLRDVEGINQRFRRIQIESFTLRIR